MYLLPHLFNHISLCSFRKQVILNQFHMLGCKVPIVLLQSVSLKPSDMMDTMDSRVITLCVLLYCRAVWFNSLTVNLKNKGKNQIKICAKIFGQPVINNFYEARRKSMIRLTNSISSDSSHILSSKYGLLPSNR